MSTARERRVTFRYKATAGAGLPDFRYAGKTERRRRPRQTIMGCFSGTLGFLMTQLEDGKTFAEAVRDAWQRGYTEPDPREDLSGRDVARKALILARTLGQKFELMTSSWNRFSLPTSTMPTPKDSSPSWWV